MRDKAIYRTYNEVVEIHDGKHAYDKDGNEIVIDNSKLAPALQEIEAEQKAKEKDHDDAKTDDDESTEGLARRLKRIERILGLK